MNYKPRYADKLLVDKLEATGAVLIQGPKWCGKTTTALQVANSVIFLQDPKVGEQALLAAEVNPSLVLEGKIPRLIDEWQLAPQLWDAIRHEVDMRNSFGQFIMTGSTTPVESMAKRHTGTGRISKLLMYPMTLSESNDSSNQISLNKLFQGETKVEGRSLKSIEDVSFLICRGGWPKSIDLSEKVALQQPLNYVDSIIDSNLPLYDGVQRNPERVKSLLRSYARFTGSDAKITEIHKDIVANNTTISYETTANYIDALKQLFVIDALPAWKPNLRSNTAIRSSDVHHYVDPSIGCAALGASPADLLNDLKTMGFLFESLCVRDLRVYAQLLDGTLYHYRDKNNLECDIIIHLRNGAYGLVEVKIGGSQIDTAAKHLKALSAKINTSKMQEPSFLMVLTAGQYAYTRNDGVHVVPLACLSP